MTIAFSRPVARLAAAVLVTCCGHSAHATLGTGLFNLFDTTLVCLDTNGTWRSLDFPDFAGRWRETKHRLYLYGNYDGGAGNDAMAFSNRSPQDFEHNPGTWTEWRDDLSWFTVATDAYIYKLADDCGGIQVKPSPPRAHPLQR